MARARSYCVRVTAFCCLASLLPSIVGAQSLPSGWLSADIGSPALSGSASHNNGTFTVIGAGADIWGTHDQFRYVYRQMTGDGTIIARVASLQRTADWAKAGVMMRESLAANSRHAFALVAPVGATALHRRVSTGGSSTHSGAAAAGWVRLQRQGATFTAARSLDGVSWKTIASQTISMPATIYVGLAVTSHNASARTRATFTNVTISGSVSQPPSPPPPSGSLPSGWSAQDIGATLAGATAFASGVFTVSAGGSDIWGTSDQFRFAYQQVAGDVDVVARVTAVQNVDTWTKAGLMIRRSLSAGSGHTFVFVTPAVGVALQGRSSDGGSSVHLKDTSGAAPIWLKLTRRGSTLTAYKSSNGTSWSVIGTQSLSLPSTFYVGLAVTSHNASTLATATFSSVSVLATSAGGTSAPAGGNQAPTVSLSSPANGATFTAPATIAVSATASDSDGTVSRVEFYADNQLIGSDTTGPSYSISWTNVAAGSYALTAVARDNDGGTTVSGARTITVRDPQMPGRAVFVPSSNHATAVSQYVVEFFPAGANPSVSNPVAIANVGKPPIVNGECSADVSQTVAGLSPGTYIATVTAIGPGGSARSAPSAPFTR